MDAAAGEIGAMSSLGAGPWYGCVPIVVAGEEIVLMPHRAAYWPARRTLLVADVHLDKCEAMRMQGMPVPRSIFDEQVARLDHAVRLTGALRVLVLGDLLHAPAGLTEAMVECFAAWRAAAPCEFALVPGNHDRGLAVVQDAWRMSILPAVYEEGPFTFVHEPEAIAGRFVWAGHVHPAVTLRSAADAIKMPCFWVGERVGVLPAFSSFTAGGSVGRNRGDRVFGIAGEQVVAL